MGRISRTLAPAALCAVAFLLGLAPARAQVTVSAVTDAAGFGPRVAPGALATIFGANLSGGKSSAPGFPLPTSLGGTSVSVNGTAAPLLYVSPGQINFQVPAATAPGTATLIVNYGSGSSAAFAFAVLPQAPAIFQDSSNNAAAQNGTTYAAITAKNPAAAGSTVVVYLTGIGAVSPSVADGAAAPASPPAKASATPTATIGGVSAKVEFLGLTPGFAGLGQANIKIPSSLAAGSYPLVVNVGGLISASAQIAVSGTGTPPPDVLSLQSTIGFNNDRKSSISALNTTGITSTGDTLAYVCGTSVISLVDLTTSKFLGSMAVNAQLNNTSGVAAIGGPCALNISSGTPVLAEALQVPSGTGAGGYFAVYSVASPLSPQFLADLPLGQSITGTTLQNISSLSFLGPYSVSTTNWYTYNSALAITNQFGDFFTVSFASPSFPALTSILGPVSGYPASSDLTPKTNSLVVPQDPNFNPVAAYVTGSTSTGASTAGNAILTVVDLQNITLPTPVNQLVSSSAATFTGFGYQYGIGNQQNLVLILGNTANRRNPGIVDAATGAPNFALTGNLTMTVAAVPNATGTSIDFESLQPVGTTVTSIPTNGTYYAQGLGGYFFAVVTQPPATDLTGPATLMIVDARNFASPAVYPVLTQYGLSSILAITSTNGEFLLAPTMSGLLVYQVNLP